METDNKQVVSTLHDEITDKTGMDSGKLRKQGSVRNRSSKRRSMAPDEEHNQKPRNTVGKKKSTANHQNINITNNYAMTHLEKQNSQNFSHEYRNCGV